MRKTAPGFGWSLNSIVVLHKITCGNLVEGHRIPRSVMRSQWPSKQPAKCGMCFPSRVALCLPGTERFDCGRVSERRREGERDTIRQLRL